MDRGLDLVFPEDQEFVHAREFRREVIGLPQETLQQVRMVRHVIEDFRRGQAVALQLQLHFAERVIHGAAPSRFLKPGAAQDGFLLRRRA